MYDAIVLGRGPLGVYTAHTLIKKGKRVLNIDAGTELKDIKKYKKVESNFNWKSEDEAPSLNKNASNVMWNGGCMSIPISELGNEFPKIPIDKESYILSVNRVKKYLNINDFDFLENKPYDKKDVIKNYEHVKDLIYTYVLNDWSFKNEIAQMENNSKYTFIENLKACTISPGESLKIECLKKDGTTVTFTSKKLYLCLGGIENTRILLNNREILKLEAKKVGTELSDHLRLPIGKIALRDIEAFKNIFDTNNNILEKNVLLPRLVKHNDKIQSYSYFKLWRYDNLFLRKFKLTFLKKIFKLSGTCMMYLFIEKPTNKNSNIKLMKDEIFPKMLASANLENTDILLFRDIIDNYFVQLSKNYGGLIKEILPIKISSDREYLNTIYSSNHPSGTTPMGGDSQKTVVNSRSQIWGFENIYVFGSSTFPRPYYVHPTFPAMVLADYSLNY